MKSQKPSRDASFVRQAISKVHAGWNSLLHKHTIFVVTIMFVIGAFALINNYFGPIDVDWLIDLWPVFLMAIGAWLIFDTVRDKKKKEDSAYE